MLSSVPILFPPSPLARLSESVTDDIFEPKILDMNWPPRLPSGELLIPDKREPGFDTRPESAPDVFAGFVTMLKIELMNPGCPAFAASPASIAAVPPCKPRCTESVDSPSCEATGPTTFGPNIPIKLSKIVLAIMSPFRKL
jgi:hypothetical protein